MSTLRKSDCRIVDAFIGLFFLCVRTSVLLSNKCDVHGVRFVEGKALASTQEIKKLISKKDDVPVRQFDCQELKYIVSDDGSLGEGSFGKVRIGFHEGCGTIAVKCIPFLGRHTAKKKLLKLITDEVNHLNKAKHNNIVRIYGFAKWSGFIGLVMEYLPSGNLLEMVRDEAIEIGLLLRLRMSSEIASGLAFIHELPRKRIVHGDLKPENILLTDDLHCKIADFGSSIISSHTGCESTLTAYGNKDDNHKNNFTLLFAAPELLQNNCMTLKPAVDTYSFGIILFFLLSRQRPIQDSQHLNLYIEKVIAGVRPQLHFIKTLLEENSSNDNRKKALVVLVHAMKQCWKQNPVERPSMVDVREQLEVLNREIPSKEIITEVLIAAEQVDSFKPSSTDHRCETIDQFAPPLFNQLLENVGSIGGSLSTANNFTPSVSSISSLAASNLTLSSTQTETYTESVNYEAALTNSQMKFSGSTSSKVFPAKKSSPRDLATAAALQFPSEQVSKTSTVSTSTKSFSNDTKPVSMAALTQHHGNVFTKQTPQISKVSSSTKTYPNYGSVTTSAQTSYQNVNTSAKQCQNFPKMLPVPKSSLSTDKISATTTTGVCSIDMLGKNATPATDTKKYEQGLSYSTAMCDEKPSKDYPVFSDLGKQLRPRPCSDPKLQSKNNKNELKTKNSDIAIKPNVSQSQKNKISDSQPTTSPSKYIPPHQKARASSSTEDSNKPIESYRRTKSLIQDKTSFDQRHTNLDNVHVSRRHASLSVTLPHSTFSDAGGNLLMIEKKEAFIFNVLTRKFEILANLKSNHSGGAVIKHDEKIYALGGWHTKSVERIDVANILNDQWIDVCPNLEFRFQAAFASLKNSIFAVGGKIDKRAQSSGEKYNSISDKWSSINDMKQERQGHALVSLEERLYAIGGKNLDSAEIYDPEKNEWKPTATMTSPRNRLAAVAVKGKIYAIGGEYNWKNLKTLECYDPHTNRWSMVGELNAARCDHGACVVNGRIHVVGGKSDLVEIYDPTSNKWTYEGSDKFRNIDAVLAM